MISLAHRSSTAVPLARLERAVVPQVLEVRVGRLRLRPLGASITPVVVCAYNDLAFRAVTARRHGRVLPLGRESSRSRGQAAARGGD